MQTTEVDDDESMDCATVSQPSGSGKQREPSEKARSRISEGIANKCSNHLLYIGKLDLPHHPVRMRYLPHSSQRYLLYGKNGYQEMTACPSPEFYSLQEISWETLACDCVQTSDMFLYVIARCHTSAVLACYDEFMFSHDMVEVRYPLGCLSSLATDLSSNHLYGINQELNCVLRFSSKDMDLNKAERFGVLWRPFDCCTSQAFEGQDGVQVQFLFVSNLDAGICVFNMNTMEIVAECCDDLSPGAKYLAYDPQRSLLFVSSSCDRLLRCYKFKFQPLQLPTAPSQLQPEPLQLPTAQSQLQPEPLQLPTATSQLQPEPLQLPTAPSQLLPTPSELPPVPLQPPPAPPQLPPAPPQLPLAPPQLKASAPAPSLKKIGDFLVAKQSGEASWGPQCVMWDPETDNLAVIGWSHARGKFCIRVFHVNV